MKKFLVTFLTPTSVIDEWEKTEPGRIQSILRALTDVRPSQLLDRKLFDFSNLKPQSPQPTIVRFRELGEPLFAE